MSWLLPNLLCYLIKNPVLSVDERVKDLLSRMTLEEKVGQLLCPLGWEMYEIKDDEVHPSEKFKRLMKEKNAGMLWATYRADPWTKKTLENGLNPELAAKASNVLQKYVIEIPVWVFLYFWLKKHLTDIWRLERPFFQPA